MRQHNKNDFGNLIAQKSTVLPASISFPAVYTRSMSKHPTQFSHRGTNSTISVTQIRQSADFIPASSSLQVSFPSMFNSSSLSMPDANSLQKIVQLKLVPLFYKNGTHNGFQSSIALNVSVTQIYKYQMSHLGKDTSNVEMCRLVCSSWVR